MRAATSVALLAFVACTHSQVVVASGESIAALGQTFAATGHLMDSALDAHAVTPEQYREWAAFTKRFKLVYEPAAALWLAAEKAGDATAAQRAAAVLTELGAQLAQFSAVVAKGAP